MTHDDSDQDRRTSDDALDRQVRAFLDCRSLIEGHIAALVRDRALADDVFQEVWVRFERVTRCGEVIANVPAWCRAAARLVALESWREQRREQGTPDPELLALVDRAYEEQDGQEELWRTKSEALGGCIDELPPRSRDLVVRRYRKGDPISTIAGQLGQSVTSLKTALCRLRLALGDCVRKKLNHLEAI